MNKKQTFLYGAMILAVGTLLVKCIGVLFKVPLTNTLGAVGMADFSTAYTIFNALYAVAISGLPVAVSKMVSENVTLGRYKDVRKIKRISLIIFLVAGLFTATLMALGSKLFAFMVGNQGAYLSILALSPAVVFCCIMASFRGYHQGLQNMYPTALSQVVEAIFKLIFGILLAQLALNFATGQFEAGNAILGISYENAGSASGAISQFGSAGAVLGVALSTAMGAIYIWIHHMVAGDGITGKQLMNSPYAKPAKDIARRLISIAVPVCLGALAINVTSLIDVGSIMNRLGTAVSRDSATLLASYHGLLPEGLTAQELPKYLYGAYTAIAVTIFNLVPALTSTFGISALPAMTAAWTSRNRAEVKRNMESIIRVTSLTAMPAGFGLMALAKPICDLLFPKVPLDAAIAAPMLQILGLAAILVALTGPLDSILQAIGRVSVPVRLILIGGSLKLITNFIFVAIPSLNIHAAPFGTILCYGTIVVLALYVLVSVTKVKLNYKSIFFKPMFAGLMCGLSAWVSYALISRVWQSSLLTVVSIGIGGLMYVVCVLCTRAICKDDLVMLPKGEKIAKILEKYSLLG